MTYSKAKLKRNGDKASACFRPYSVGNASDKYKPTDFTIDLIETHCRKTKLFHEKAVQYLSIET
jgi:hypothetical protein